MAETPAAEFQNAGATEDPWTTVGVIHAATKDDTWEIDGGLAAKISGERCTKGSECLSADRSAKI